MSNVLVFVLVGTIIFGCIAILFAKSYWDTKEYAFNQLDIFINNWETVVNGKARRFRIKLTINNIDNFLQLAQNSGGY